MPRKSAGNPSGVTEAVDVGVKNSTGTISGVGVAGGGSGVAVAVHTLGGVAVAVPLTTAAAVATSAWSRDVVHLELRAVTAVDKLFIEVDIFVPSQPEDHR